MNHAFTATRWSSRRFRSPAILSPYRPELFQPGRRRVGKIMTAGQLSASFKAGKPRLPAVSVPLQLSTRLPQPRSTPAPSGDTTSSASVLHSERDLVESVIRESQPSPEHTEANTTVSEAGEAGLSPAAPAPLRAVPLQHVIAPSPTTWNVTDLALSLESLENTLFTVPEAEEAEELLLDPVPEPAAKVLELDSPEAEGHLHDEKCSDPLVAVASPSPLGASEEQQSAVDELKSAPVQEHKSTSTHTSIFDCPLNNILRIKFADAVLSHGVSASLQHLFLTFENNAGTPFARIGALPQEDRKSAVRRFSEIPTENSLKDALSELHFIVQVLEKRYERQRTSATTPPEPIHVLLECCGLAYGPDHRRAVLHFFRDCGNELSFSPLQRSDFQWLKQCVLQHMHHSTGLVFHITAALNTSSNTPSFDLLDFEAELALCCVPYQQNDKVDALLHCRSLGFPSVAEGVLPAPISVQVLRKRVSALPMVSQRMLDRCLTEASSRWSREQCSGSTHLSSPPRNRFSPSRSLQDCNDGRVAGALQHLHWCGDARVVSELLRPRSRSLLASASGWRSWFCFRHPPLPCFPDLEAYCTAALAAAEGGAAAEAECSEAFLRLLSSRATSRCRSLHRALCRLHHSKAEPAVRLVVADKAWLARCTTELEKALAALKREGQRLVVWISKEALWDRKIWLVAQLRQLQLLDESGAGAVVVIEVEQSPGTRAQLESYTSIAPRAVFLSPCLSAVPQEWLLRGMPTQLGRALASMHEIRLPPTSTFAEYDCVVMQAVQQCMASSTPCICVGHRASSIPLAESMRLALQQLVTPLHDTARDALLSRLSLRLRRCVGAPPLTAILPRCLSGASPPLNAEWADGCEAWRVGVAALLTENSETNIAGAAELVFLALIEYACVLLLRGDVRSAMDVNLLSIAALHLDPVRSGGLLCLADDYPGGLSTLVQSLHSHSSQRAPRSLALLNFLCEETLPLECLTPEVLLRFQQRVTEMRT